MPRLPSLPLDKWEESKNTLHLFMQIVGKVRMALFPRMNHWWHVPLYVSCHGLTTRPIPYADKLFEINFDLLDHRLNIDCSDGPSRYFALDELSVADFYRQLFSTLHQFDIDVAIKAEPYDVPFSNIPFTEDEVHASYDRAWIQRYWQVIKFVDQVFEIFRGRFNGKSTPVHLFWHHADLALTRFSGDPAPPLTTGSKADQEAYSHEVISAGFWVGDDQLREPAFYTYVYPEPQGLSNMVLQPSAAEWHNDYGYSMAFMPYEAIRNAGDPEQALLIYLQSAYEACARQAGWELEKYTNG